MTGNDLDSERIAILRSNLLGWYECNQRDLPWRHSRDPYAIWISEVMLQQTRVAVVIERYQAFLSRFPTLLSLALASEEQVLALWSGLGYYRRARMLHKAAQFVANAHQGNLPTTATELRKLPGIGDYTAAAIASIAHGEASAVVDGNVVRVLCRLTGWEAGTKTGSSSLRRKIDAKAAELIDRNRPGDFNQAMMELGALVCTPRNPQCSACPLLAQCVTQGEHKTAPRPRMSSLEVGYALSVRISASSAKKNSHSHALREVLLEQRPASEGVMPGLWELPSLLDPNVPEENLRMTLRHAIMYTNYYVRIRTVFEDDVPALTESGGKRLWVPLDEARDMALTGLARKVLARAHLLPTPPMDAFTRQSDEIL